MKSLQESILDDEQSKLDDVSNASFNPYMRDLIRQDDAIKIWDILNDNHIAPNDDELEEIVRANTALADYTIGVDCEQAGHQVVVYAITQPINGSRFGSSHKLMIFNFTDSQTINITFRFSINASSDYNFKYNRVKYYKRILKGGGKLKTKGMNGVTLTLPTININKL